MGDELPDIRGAGMCEPIFGAVSLPGQNESNLSSIEIEPCPCGLSSAMRLYIDTIANSVRATMSRVAMGERAPAASAAIPGI